MTSPSLPCIPNLTLLLIEPHTLGQSTRAAELAASQYCVTTAENLKDLYMMKSVFSFSVAVLSDMVGDLALRASAQVVRGQWPKARILILGKAPHQFDDHLYDESLTHASDGMALLAMLDKMTKNSWKQESGAHAAWCKRVSWAEWPQQRRPVQESDPTKMPGLVQKADSMRSRPANERPYRVLR